MKIVHFGSPPGTTYDPPKTPKPPKPKEPPIRPLKNGTRS